MDVSILQHSRDSSPQQVAVAEVVELIRGSQWPPGYQPLLIAASVVMGGRLRKHVRWLTELGVVRLTGKKEEVKGKRELVQDDPHTVLCWAVRASTKRRGSATCCRLSCAATSTRRPTRAPSARTTNWCWPSLD